MSSLEESLLQGFTKLEPRGRGGYRGYRSCTTPLVTLSRYEITGANQRIGYSCRVMFNEAAVAKLPKNLQDIDLVCDIYVNERDIAFVFNAKATRKTPARNVLYPERSKGRTVATVTFPSADMPAIDFSQQPQSARYPVDFIHNVARFTIQPPDAPEGTKTTE